MIYGFNIRLSYRIRKVVRNISINILSHKENKMGLQRICIVDRNMRENVRYILSSVDAGIVGRTISKPSTVCVIILSLCY